MLKLLDIIFKKKAENQGVFKDFLFFKEFEGLDMMPTCKIGLLQEHKNWIAFVTSQVTHMVNRKSQIQVHWVQVIALAIDLQLRRQYTLLLIYFKVHAGSLNSNI